MTIAADKNEESVIREVRWPQIAIVLSATLATAVYGFTWNSVSVALPHMQGAFSATTDQVTWVMISFVIGSAAMTASVGYLSDIFGRKTIFIWCIVGFTVTLLGCGTATTLEQMVLWRLIQGACGAGLLPLGQIFAVNAFPPERHGQATSLWALGFITSNVVSPAIAGVIVDAYSWRFVFYLTIPLALIAFIASWVLLPKVPKRKRKTDMVGFSALLIGVSVLQLMLARGERLDWFDSTEIIIETIIATLALYWFILNTLTSERPFFDRELFLNRNYNLGVLFIFIIGSVLFLPMLLVPLQLQQISGYSPIDTGYLLLSRGVGSVIGFTVLSRFRDRWDPRPVLLFGLLGTGWASWSMAQWTVDIRAIDVIWTNLLHGIATAAIWAPLNTLTLSKISKRIQDQAFAFFYLAFDIGSAIGTAIVISLHARYSQINQSILTEHITNFDTPIPLPSQWSVANIEGIASLNREVIRQATMIAFNESFMIVAIVLFSLIPCILFFKPHRG